MAQKQVQQPQKDIDLKELKRQQQDPRHNQG